MTADDLGTLEREARQLLELSNLKAAVESDDDEFVRLITRVRGESSD